MCRYLVREFAKFLDYKQNTRCLQLYSASHTMRYVLESSLYMNKCYLFSIKWQ